ncbi:TrbC/VirB2 family protein, partial [Treponema sp.]|uniref:TrbC/VirB2 family protein n=1 Tax=Treponema sp. TaxID=166 RepID=UPI00388F11C2
SNFFKSFKKTVTSKKFITVAAVLALCVVPTFAASGSGESIVELDNWADKILELFQSSWVKAILLVALIVEAIGMVLAGQQGGGGQMIKKFAPWIIGTIILLSASSICSYFLDDLNFEVAMIPQIQNTVDMAGNSLSAACV